MYILITYFMDMFELVYIQPGQQTNVHQKKKMMMGDDVNEESRILREVLFMYLLYTK